MDLGLALRCVEELKLMLDRYDVSVQDAEHIRILGELDVERLRLVSSFRSP
jgi:hypothetical protein